MLFFFNTWFQEPSRNPDAEIRPTNRTPGFGTVWACIHPLNAVSLASFWSSGPLTKVTPGPIFSLYQIKTGKQPYSHEFPR